jgi:hypothetical protein
MLPRAYKERCKGGLEGLEHHNGGYFFLENTITGTHDVSYIRMRPRRMDTGLSLAVNGAMAVGLFGGPPRTLCCLNSIPLSSLSKFGVLS